MNIKRVGPHEASQSCDWCMETATALAYDCGQVVGAACVGHERLLGKADFEPPLADLLRETGRQRRRVGQQILESSGGPVTHVVHPDTHEFGLADGCPRCAEQAEHPFESLDDGNLRALYSRVVGEQEPRSAAEAAAMRVVESFRRWVRRMEAVRDQPKTEPTGRRTSGRCICPASPVPHEHMGTGATFIRMPPKADDVR